MENKTLKDSSSAIIILESKILLFHRDNIPTIPAPDTWSLPGGGIEKGETPEEGIVRELVEEVNYSPKNLKFLFRYTGSNGSLAYIYGAFVDESEAKLFKHNPGEGQGIAFFTLEEISRLKLPPGLKMYLNNNIGLFEEVIRKQTFEGFDLK